jgi:ABC-type transport system involved in multi-copper enzyme maturation permease subunit
MTNVWTITWLTFHEARRRRMVLMALVLGAAFLVLYLVGFSFVTREMRQDLEFESDVMLRFGYNLLLMAGFYVIHFLTVMLAIFSSVDTISGEITSHTIQTLVTKPIMRWQVMLGKWLGYALMIAVYLGLLSGGVLLGVYVLVGYVPPNALQGSLLLMLEALVLFSLSFLGGTRFSTLTNGVMLFMLYGVAFIGSWVEQIGSLLQSQAAVRIGIITSLLLPVEVLWRRISYVMQPTFLRQIPSPFSLTSAPSAAMVVYAALYGVLMLGLAVRAFNKRDL